MFTVGAGVGVVALSVGVLMFEGKYEGNKKTAVGMLKETADSVSFLNVSIIFGRDIAESESLIANKGGCAIINDISSEGVLELGTAECSGACDMIMKKAATFNKAVEIKSKVSQFIVEMKQNKEQIKNDSKVKAILPVKESTAFSKIDHLIHVVTPNYDKSTRTQEIQIGELSTSYLNALNAYKEVKAFALPILGSRSGFPFEISVILAIHHAFCCGREVYIHVNDKSRFDEVRRFFMERVQDYDKIQEMTTKQKEEYFKSHMWSSHYSKAMLECVKICPSRK